MKDYDVGSRIKVCFCTDGVYPLMMGGMQKYSRLLCEALADYSDIELYVLHPHGNAKIFLDDRIKEIFITGIDVNKNYLLESYKYSKRIYNALQDLQPDVVYSQGFSVWYKASEFGRRLIINPHGLEPYQSLDFKNKLLAMPFRLIFNRLFNQSAFVISLGGRLSEILTKVVKTPSKIIEIPNAINLPANRTERNFDKVVFKGLFLARFAHNKGINILFDAIHELELLGISDKFEFMLGGKGPLYEYYKKRQKSYTVRLLGYVEDECIPDLYEQADFFVFPTLYEGMPTVVLEAMSYGLPVIVSDVGATRLLVNDQNGKIIKAGSVSELVNALIWFYDLKSNEKDQMSIASYNRIVSLFTWHRVAKMHYELFVNLAQ